MTTPRPDAMFYQLTRRSVENAVVDLLERTLGNRWRATVRVGLADRVPVLDRHLWTYRDDAFLPHGAVADDFAARQPIYLTAGEETPNDPQVLMLVHRAAMIDADLERLQRIVVLFDGGNADALAEARDMWRRAVGGGRAARYWIEDQSGRWSKRHERA